MLEAEILRIIAAILSVTGSVLLAWRVKGILDALAFVADIHDSNIMQLSGTQQNVVIATNAPVHIKRAKAYWLLITGFGLLALSGILNLLAFLCT